MKCCWMSMWWSTQQDIMEIALLIILWRSITVLSCGGQASLQCNHYSTVCPWNVFYAQRFFHNSAGVLYSSMGFFIIIFHVGYLPTLPVIAKMRRLNKSLLGHHPSLFNTHVGVEILTSHWASLFSHSLLCFSPSYCGFELIWGSSQVESAAHLRADGLQRHAGWMGEYFSLLNNNKKIHSVGYEISKLSLLRTQISK